MSIKPMTSAFPQLKQLSEIYPVLFALLVVFFFRPIHSKLQAGVDRLFYRGKYDYKDAVISLGDTLTTVYDLKEIIIRIIHAARDIMSIDSAGVILIQPEQQECPALFVYDAPEGSSIEKIEEDCLELDDPVVSLIRNEKKLITKYDIAEDPRYAAVREECSEQLKSLRATMALPLVFQGQTTGILMLGNKKSGHFFMGEDIDILTTLASQGAIAIENAKRAEILKDEEIVRSNLARYLSPQVVDNVMRQRMKVDLGGQRKLVTVLISDIRAFTDLVNTQHPDQLEKILNEYFTEMATIIFENKGSLDKYIGDAIVAVFGSLIPLQNPTVNAVDTSIRMVTRMADLNRKWAIVFNGFHMDIGVGIDTGEVFLGSVGSPDRMEFTVIGRAVNTAQLLSDIAQPDQILLTEDAVKAFGDVSRLRELDPLPVAGYDEQLKIFEIVMAKNNEGVITGTD